MSNPWMDIHLEDYEGHMQLDTVRQLPVLNQMMEDQLCRYSSPTIMILGIAGGNGLNHIDPNKISKVYGVDINPNYLAVCKDRYPSLTSIFHPVQADLSDSEASLPPAELVVANLLVEYIGCACFQQVIRKVNPDFVSAIIQINEDPSETEAGAESNAKAGFVSASPYACAFTRLDEVHHQMSEALMMECMKEIGYLLCYSDQKVLPNGKKLVRLDFSL
ncbi:class I SAM-dependent methyltransferase [Anoxybacterium hadale]|uniref:Class I SAM-dependent methyltransferase n=1 Tax=Anoxybacterium hadale TaxID=3408580 RepID=A0ACD1ACD3_9FIRM|nr:class I SAM-dependent methyltransferase [Clostridiales bacterium]